MAAATAPAATTAIATPETDSIAPKQASQLNDSNDLICQDTLTKVDHN